LLAEELLAEEMLWSDTLAGNVSDRYLVIA
jgi:hypothetical protein